MGSEDYYKPIIVMIACQFIYSGITLSCRAALLEGMSARVFLVYRQATAFLLIAPIAYRKGTRTCLGWKNLWSISLLSLVGITVCQNIYFEGLHLASSSAASALGNLVPGITFIMAYSIRLEKIHIRNVRSWAKIIGTMVCVGGAVSIALLKGPKLLNREIQFLQRSDSIFKVGHDEGTWLIGCLLVFGSTCCWSLWLIMQVHVTATYHDHVSLTAWTCLLATFQCGIVTLIFEHDIDSWKLKSGLQVLSCLYAGLASAITVFAQAYCISRRGPLFSALFSPLSTVIVTVFASIFMHEELYTGSLIGALALITGLYIVLWGKANDYEDTNKEINDQFNIETDQTIITLSSENKDCKSNLEEPLLPVIPENLR